MGGMPVTAVWDQDSFRFRNDDGDEGTATWAAAVNTDISLGLDTNFRLRLLMQETAGSNSSENPTFELHASRNGGTFALITSATHCKFNQSPHLPFETSDNVQRIGSGTLRYGAVYESASDSDGTAATAGNDEYEFECVLSLSSANGAVGDDTFDFKLWLGSAYVDTVTALPRITVTSNSRTATAAITQAGQTVSSAGTVDIAATAAITGADQTVTSAGAVLIAADAAITQAGQTVAATGTSLVESIGTAAITQAGQTVSATGVVLIAGTASINQAGQTVSGAAALDIDATASVTQSGQTVSAIGALAITGALSITTSADTLSSAATGGEADETPSNSKHKQIRTTTVTPNRTSLLSPLG